MCLLIYFLYKGRLSWCNLFQCAKKRPTVGCGVVRAAMKRRLGDCSDGGGRRPAGSSQYPAEALPQPLLSWTCPRWAFLLQELSPSRFVAASVCTDSLALVSLQVVDRAISASAMGMEVLKSSAVSSATALFAECMGAGR